MLSPNPLPDLPDRLIVWQKQHGRSGLPWQSRPRQTDGICDPYPVWLSEIMLQQTQVGTVTAYFHRFIEAFPDLPALAAAPLEQVLGLWSGLGYYARARNLHACARLIMDRYDGAFPRSVRELTDLPGLGRSTAAAIAAFAYGDQAAILDGNVKRVLARVFAIEGWPGQAAVQKRLWEKAESLLPVSDIRAYTQGLMDLGAMVCTRSSPACRSCPLMDGCLAFAQQRTHELPARRPGKVMPQRQASVAVVGDRLGVILERRPPTGIWGGLLSLPEMPELPEAADPVNGEIVVDWAIRNGLAVEKTPAQLAPLKHTFTHFHLHLQPVVCRLTAKKLSLLAARETDTLRFTPWEALVAAPLPTPIRRILLNAAKILREDPL